MDKETRDRRWAALIESWQGDPGFRSRMEADPKATLTECGFDVPGALTDVRLAVNSEDTVHMVFPPEPNRGLSDAELQNVVGGIGGHSWGWLFGGWGSFFEISPEVMSGARYSLNQ